MGKASEAMPWIAPHSPGKGESSWVPQEPGKVKSGLAVLGTLKGAVTRRGWHMGHHISAKARRGAEPSSWFCKNPVPTSHPSSPVCTIMELFRLEKTFKSSMTESNH